LIPLAAALNGATMTNAQPWPLLLAAGLPLPDTNGLPTRLLGDGATPAGPELGPAGEPRLCDDAGAGWADTGWADTGAAGCVLDCAGAGTEELWESCELCEEW
jgi:hypothetical protein